MINHYIFRAVSLCAALCLAVVLSWGCGGSGSVDAGEDALPGADPVVTDDLEDSHPDGWQNPDAHGDWVLENGVEGCYACHRRESDGTEEEPACTSCHSNYPHETGWGDGVNHGAYVSDNGFDSCESACHGTDLGGGTSGVACTSCHANYPHTDADTITAFDCGSCHDNGAGTSKQTKISLEAQSDCYGCHWSYPHMSYDLPGSIPGTGIREWQNPTADNYHPASDPAFTMGHLWYLLRNPLLVDDVDIRPWGGMRIGHADHPAAVENTCGGVTPGQCHFSGNRSLPHADLDSRLCAQYCH